MEPHAKQATSPPPAPGGPDWRWCLAACAGLSGLALLRYGLPLDLFTLIALCVGLALASLVRIGATRRRRWALASLPLLFHLQLHVPWESDWLQDVRGGRQGVELTPGLRFGRDGRNTALLEDHLGPLPAEWRHQAIRSLLIGDWRDGNERVDSRSLLRSEQLESALARLPDREARVQVLRCLTDSRNLLRVHQGLLLTCLDALGFPAGQDAASWWAAHRWAFVAERDPERAALVCQGWTDRARELAQARTSAVNLPAYEELPARIGACTYQEQGGWGGDAAFGAAFQRIRCRLPNAAGPPPGGSITWWPRDPLREER